MKKQLSFALITTLFFASSSQAFADDFSRIRDVMQSVVGIKNGTGDVRLLVSLSEDATCPSEMGGNVYRVEFQIKKRSRNLKVINWLTVKQYEVSKELVSQVSNSELKQSLLDVETCR